MWKGEWINKSTRASNMKTARIIESRIRAELALGNFGTLEMKSSPTLADFLSADFLPYVEAKHEAKPNTLEYYQFGVKALLDSDLSRLTLEDINDQVAHQFEAQKKTKWQASTINCPLRTLRHALKLAEDWGKMKRSPRITLAKGERQRERVLSNVEVAAYFALCDQPWRDAATLVYGAGMRPGEVFSLDWRNVDLRERKIRVAEGKSKAARRLLPMLPEVYEVLLARHEMQRHPIEGWVFPSSSRCGHLEQGTSKGQHDRALKRLATATVCYNQWLKQNVLEPMVEWVAEKAHLPASFIERHRDVIIAGLNRFEPYTLRHSALTRLAAAGCDPFTLARIAGHSSITITQRYCHPQEDTVQRAFQNLNRPRLVTDGSDRPKTLVSGEDGKIQLNRAQDGG